MTKKNEPIDWKWWWKQVEKGLVPECTYRMARIRDKERKRYNEICRIQSNN